MNCLLLSLMKKKLAIGIDIGGTNTDFGIVDKEGNCLSKQSISTDKYDDVVPFLDELTKSLNNRLKNLKGSMK